MMGAAGFLEQEQATKPKDVPIVDITHEQKTTIMIYTTKDEITKILSDNGYTVDEKNYSEQLSKFTNENVNDFAAIVRANYLSKIDEKFQTKYA